MPVINTNMPALSAQRHLNRSTNNIQQSAERLSSGLRINRAKDDAAGLAISERMTSQIRGTEQAIRNINDGISLVQTAEGALQEITEAIQHAREKVVQAWNGTYSEDDRVSIANEAFEILAGSKHIEEQTTFNGIRLLDGATPVTIQAGDSAGSDNQIVIPLVDTQASNALTGNGLASLPEHIQTFILGGPNVPAGPTTFGELAFRELDNALEFVTGLRADFGAVHNRMESAVRNLENMVESTQASRSRIKDADYARETAELTKNQILQQAGHQSLVQVKGLPELALQLLTPR